MISSDFHMHTTFTDGNDTPEQMTKTAIALGLRSIGFSEHAYVPFDPPSCLSPESTVEYRREIRRLKEKYAGQIEILCGIEMDFDSEDASDDYDYVIGSVHYVCAQGEMYCIDYSPEETMRCIRYGFGGDATAMALAYFERVAQVREKTGADIVAHFDLVSKFCGVLGMEFDPESYRRAWQTAMPMLSEHCVFEINTGAMSRGYKKEPYPSAEMLRYLYNLGGRVMLAGDAHSKENIGFELESAKTLAETIGFSSFGFTDRQGKEHIQL